MSGTPETGQAGPRLAGAASGTMEEPQVRAMHEAMSPESRRMRFFSSGTATISELSRRICAAPSRGHQALLAVLDDEVIGGYTELWRLDRSGALDERLAA